MNLDPRAAVFPMPPGNFVLRGIGWKGYQKILEVIGDRPLRSTYLCGDLELMSPLNLHEVWKKAFGRLFDLFAEELDLPLRGCGSATFSREDQDRGLEPDEGFYLANAHLLRHWPDIDLSRDPPPDLAVEVDITTTCLDRFAVCSGLRVPEIWRFDGDALHVHCLGADGTYQPSEVSRALPFLPLEEIVPVLRRSQELDPGEGDGVFLRFLRAWVRERVLPLYRAAAPPPSGPPG
jgi:Uma2 family endonuclease